MRYFKKFNKSKILFKMYKNFKNQTMVKSRGLTQLRKTVRKRY